MEKNQPSGAQLPPEILAQLAAQQAGQKALIDAGLDVPRMFASIIGLSDDPINGVVALIFRDGVRAEFQIINSVGGEPVTQTQEAFRTVTSIVVPRETVKQFVKGAAEYFKAQDASTNG